MTAEKLTQSSDGIDASRWKFWKRRRTTIAWLASLGVQVLCLTRLGFNSTVDTITVEQDYALSNGDREHLVSSFLYGYLVTQIPGGVLASWLGSTTIIGIGVAGSSLLALITPLVATGGGEWLTAVRVLQGMFQGVVFPGLHHLWTQWAPPTERSFLVLTPFIGIMMGTAKALVLSEVLEKFVSWESVFYIFGALGCLWCVFWIKFVSESPEADPRITKQEREFITQSLGNVEHRSLRHPWKAMFTSSAVFACAAAAFCNSWGYNTVLTKLPTFLKETLNFEVTPHDFIATFPYLATMIAMSIAGHLADRFQNKGTCTATQVRRNFTCAAFIAQVIFMLAGALVLNAILTSILMALATAMSGFAMAGYIVNLLDLSPKSAGVMMGLVGTFGTIADITSPVIIGVLTSNGTFDEWKVVFLITAGIYSIGCFVYWCFASGELQTWTIDMHESQTTRC